MSQLRVWADDARTKGVAFAKTFITPIGNTSPLASRVCDAGGSTAWDELCPQRNTPYLLEIAAPGFRVYSERHENIFQDIDVTLTPLPITLSRLVRIDRNTHRMVDENGTHVYGRGADAFLLYKKYLDADRATVDAVLLQFESLGCNLIRVFGMFESLGGFNPKAYPEYYDKIVSFCALCESYGLYVYWVACAATGAWFTEDEAVQHAKRTADQLTQTRNALFSYVNEQGQHNNSVNRNRFKAEVNTGWMLYDTGSFGEDQLCQPPFGTHAVLHPKRKWSNVIRDGCPLDNGNYLNDGLEVGIDEGDRYGDEGNTSVQQAGDAAGTAYCALLFVFHSMQGERSEVLTGNTLDCAAAAFAAMRNR